MKTASTTNGSRGDLKFKLATSATGRIVLHVFCLVRDHKLHWHWAGICREFHHPHH